MTLGDGKRKTLMLMDEYSSGGTLTPDEDINLKMNDFFDLAQKQLANYQKIIHEVEVDPETEGEEWAGQLKCRLPEDFVQPFRVWRKGSPTRQYRWAQQAILVPKGTGKLQIEYFACPSTISRETPDSYVFEVSEQAAACLPYYVAAQQLVVDLVVDYRALLDLYDRMVSALDVSLPGTGTGRVAQRLYRG